MAQTKSITNNMLIQKKKEKISVKKLSFFATNPNFLIQITLKPYGVKLLNSKLRSF